MFSYFLPFQFEIKHCAILLPWKLFLSNESRSFCTRLFLFRFINRNRNTAQKEYALRLVQVSCIEVISRHQAHSQLNGLDNKKEMGGWKEENFSSLQSHVFLSSLLWGGPSAIGQTKSLKETHEDETEKGETGKTKRSRKWSLQCNTTCITSPFVALLINHWLSTSCNFERALWGNFSADFLY